MNKTTTYAPKIYRYNDYHTSLRVLTLPKAIQVCSVYPDTFAFPDKQPNGSYKQYLSCLLKIRPGNCRNKPEFRGHSCRHPAQYL